jgi:hypothetical protein
MPPDRLGKWADSGVLIRRERAGRPEPGPGGNQRAVRRLSPTAALTRSWPLGLKTSDRAHGLLGQLPLAIELICGE